jgi:hypothetical protein
MVCRMDGRDVGRMDGRMAWGMGKGMAERIVDMALAGNS